MSKQVHHLQRARGLALLAVGMLAAYVPARRASLTDPAIVLRQQ